MKSTIFIAISIFTIFFAGLVNQIHASLIDPKLKRFISQNSLSKQKVIVLFKVPQHLPVPQRYQRKHVIQYLQTAHYYNSLELKKHLSTSGLKSSDFKILDHYWINLSMSIELNSKALTVLSRSAVVHKIYFNDEMLFPTLPVRKKLFNPQQAPYNFIETNLKQLIDEAPQIDGSGILIGHIDTGVDGKHPDLKDKIHLFFNGDTTGEPHDKDGHGTHTAGTILGGKRIGQYIGVAPGAKLASAGYLDDYAQMLRGMQWILDPDGNPQTNDSPRVVSNSWNAEGAPDLELFYRAINSWEAAGIITVFSAGNAGPGDESITRPHEHPYVIAVGATGPGGKIAQFSSRGPAYYKGQMVEKPDLTAPGVDINSTLPYNKYGSLTGTSMACPHVAGTIALMLQVNPQLTPLHVKEILKSTATHVDSQGNEINVSKWNKMYGYGRLNIYKAVMTSLSLYNRNNILQSGIDYFTINTESTNYGLGVSNYIIPFNLESTSYFEKPIDEGRWISSTHILETF